MPILECNQVKFYSPGDEAAFFESIGSIKAIRKTEGIGDTLFLHIPKRLSNAALRELIALFRRYHIDMSQLAQFRSDTNREWFADPRSFWYQSVFANPSKTSE